MTDADLEAEIRSLCEGRIVGGTDPDDVLDALTNVEESVATIAEARR
jgi:hypothetical protein